MGGIEEDSIVSPKKCLRNIDQYNIPKAEEGLTSYSCKNPLSPNLGVCPVAVTIKFSSSRVGYPVGFTNGDQCSLLDITKEKDVPERAKKITEEGKRKGWFKE